MGINDIGLPAQAIEDLYGQMLIGDATTNLKEKVSTIAPIIKTTAEAATDSSLKWLGNNEQQVLIVVSNPDTTYLPDKQLTFLTGILTACRLSIADVAIINTARQTNLTYKEALAALQSKKVMLFGIEPAAFGLPMNFPPYQLQAFTGVTYLAAPTLVQLENDKVEKSKLWVCLKKMFEI